MVQAALLCGRRLRTGERRKAGSEEEPAFRVVLWCWVVLCD
jgi:hypothetical protein